MSCLSEALAGGRSDLAPCGSVSNLQDANTWRVMMPKAVAHNPTGVDPTPEQWDKIVAACKERASEAFSHFRALAFAIRRLLEFKES